jgi:hypothetical protein
MFLNELLEDSSKSHERRTNMTQVRTTIGGISRDIDRVAIKHTPNRVLLRDPYRELERKRQDLISRAMVIHSDPND